MLVRGSWSRLDGVAYAADGPDELPRVAAVDLVTHVVDVDLDEVAGRVAVVVPDVLGDQILQRFASRERAFLSLVRAIADGRDHMSPGLGRSTGKGGRAVGEAA
jgi:hypothetical protein